MHVGLNVPTTSGWWEYQACFTPKNKPISLSTNGDYIEYSVTFTNYGLLNETFTTSGSMFWIGLYDSGGTIPLAGDLSSGGLNANSGSAFAAGNCQNWQGYVSQVVSNGAAGASAACIFTRPMQNGASTVSAHQDLVVFPSNTGSFKDPVGTQYVVTPATSVVILSNGLYTVLERITLISNSCVAVSNALVNGLSGSTSYVFSQVTTNIVGNGYLSSTFDGMSFGAMNKSAPNCLVDVDIINVKVAGAVTPYCAYPIIKQQPIAVSCPAGASAEFESIATGVGLTYQWFRHGTNLTQNGNSRLSGTSGDIPSGGVAKLIISPVTTADLELADGYYCVFTNPTSCAGDLTTNSSHVTLNVTGSSRNLIWNGAGASTWDLNNHASWTGGPLFNYGDSVTFDDSGSANYTVNLSGDYLSASNVYAASSQYYDLTGTGDYNGPGMLIYKGSAPGTAGPFEIDNANDYSGGTIVSNANADLILHNYGALGSGPVILNCASGGTAIMEITPVANAGIGIQGDIKVLHDFEVIFYAAGAYGGSFLGDLSGTSGSTLTIMDSVGTGSTNVMVRLYGDNTVYNGNLKLNDTRVTWACYNTDSNQVYNGVISGSGDLKQRDNGNTILNGVNTFTGGTTPTTGAIGFGNDACLGGGPLNIAPIAPNLAGAGQVFASAAARTIANTVQYPSGSNNLTLTIGGTNALTFTCSTITLGGVDGAGFGYTTNALGVPNSGSGFPTNRIFNVTNTALTTISGVIQDGTPAGYGLIKTGNGTLALTGVETYPGATIATNCAGVRSGALWINGSLSASSVVTVQSNGVIGGSGTINGPVTVSTNGWIAPGAGTVGGTLTINNSLTFNGGSVMIRVLRPSTSDSLSVSGGIVNNFAVNPTTLGALPTVIVVTNTGAALQVGDSFTVFNTAVTGGNNIVVTGGGVTWTPHLTSTPATITVAGTGACIIANNVIQQTNYMSWPAGYTGMILQSNMVGLIYSPTNWHNLPNTQYTNTYTAIPNQSRTNVFYRLISQ
jgi:autotransporter-associated beta strand protein